MSANFTPTFGAYSPLTPFRYWCQKVLPLVYDDSLSYYELLNKVVDYLNKTMEDVETLHGDTEAMLAAFNQLQTYVNTYFDELDLTTEIEAALDKLAENGTLTLLIQPFIPDAVSSWLAENVEPVGSAVALDKTLTIEGAAADSKAVGDKIKKTLYLGLGGDVTLLPANTDMNTVLEEGNYRLTTANASSAINYPSAAGGRITVLYKTTVSTLMQIIFGADSIGKIWYRGKSGDNWSKWYTVSNTDDLTQLNNAILQIQTDITGIGEDLDTHGTDIERLFNASMFLGLGENVKLLPANTDMNSVTAEGNYRLSTKNASSAINYPSAAGGRITVLYKTTTDTLMQIVFGADATGKIWYRGRAGGNWSKWYTVSNQDDISALTTSISELNASVDDTRNNYFKLNLGTEVTILGANVDFNELKTEGNYRISNSNARTALNAPSTAGARILVLLPFQTSQAIQIWMGIAGIMCWRAFNTNITPNAWTEWFRVCDREEMLKYYHNENIATQANIESALTNYSYCKIPAGTINITTLTMPDFSCIEGSGRGSVLNVSGKIEMGFGCTIKNIKIVGPGGESYTADGNVTNVNGIEITKTNTDTSQWKNKTRAIITECEICGFTGSGIYQNNTGVNYENSITVSDTYLHNNNVGLNIHRSGEFGNFANVKCARNYYGCICNGGNNYFSSCNFSGNFGNMYFDNSDGLATNNSHSTLSACNFHHCWANGFGLKVDDMASGIMIIGCQFAYAGLTLLKASGIVFSGCNFLSDSPIAITDGGGIIMTGCMFRSKTDSAITITNNTGFHMVSCYNRDGLLYDDHP